MAEARPRSSSRRSTAASISALRGFRNQIALATEVVGVLLLTLLAVALVFTVLQAFRYARCAAYDIAQRLPEWAGIGVGYVILAQVAVLPLALNVGLVGMLICWLAIAMFYQTLREHNRALRVALLTDEQARANAAAERLTIPATMLAIVFIAILLGPSLMTLMSNT